MLASRVLLIRHNPRFRRTIDLRVWRYHIPEVNSVLDCACVVGWPTRNDGCYVALWRHGLMADSTRDPSLLPPSRVLNCRMLLNTFLAWKSCIWNAQQFVQTQWGLCILWTACDTSAHGIGYFHHLRTNLLLGSRSERSGQTVDQKRTEYSDQIRPVVKVFRSVSCNVDLVNNYDDDDNYRGRTWAYILVDYYEKLTVLTVLGDLEKYSIGFHYIK